MNYKKLLIQRQSYNGTSYTNVGSIVDTYAAYGVVCQEFPFKYLPERKEPASRDWNDEDGEDVYIPSNGLRYKAYDMEVKFLYVGSQMNMANDLKNFIEFICGKDLNQPILLAVYDEYTQTGRRGLYVKEIDNDLVAYDNVNLEVIATFKVKFHVTDPVTRINANMNII